MHATILGEKPFIADNKPRKKFVDSLYIVLDKVVRNVKIRALNPI